MDSKSQGLSPIKVHCFIKAKDFSKLAIDQIEVDITKEDEDRTLSGLQ
jgi:hypothetical protein